MARPSKYDEKVTPQLAKWMRRSGLTDTQIAEQLDISESTLNEWKKIHPAFSESLKESANFVDSLVEDSLHRDNTRAGRDCTGRGGRYQDHTEAHPARRYRADILAEEQAEVEMAR
jgi:hypothetical protein